MMARFSPKQKVVEMAQKKRAKVKRSTPQAPVKEPMNQNTKIMIALGAVVVVLIVVLGFMWSQRQGDVVANQATQTQAANTDTSAGMGGGTAADIKEVEFDTATATKVPKDETPEKFLERYLTLVDKKEYGDAFKMLPLDRQNYYKDAMTFGTQLDGYGIDGHSTKVVSEGKDDDGNEQIVIHGTMKTANGNFGNDWTFVNVDGQWYVKTRGEVIFDQ